MASKGQKYKKWTAEEKYKIIKPALDMEISTFQITKDTGLNNGMINNWIKEYREKKILMRGDGSIINFMK